MSTPVTPATITSTGDAGGDPRPPQPPQPRTSPLIDKRTLTDACRQGVAAAGSAAHDVLARDELEREAGLFLTTEADERNIGDPLANMLHRRGADLGGGNPDLADVIRLAIGAAVYLGRNLQARVAIRRARKAAASGGPFIVDAGGEATS